MLYLLPFLKVFGSVSYNYNVRNNFNLRVNVQHVVKIIFFLKYHTNCLYEQLIDISSIDYINKKFRFELFYNIRSIRYNNRIFLTCLLYEADTVATVTNIYPNAN